MSDPPAGGEPRVPVRGVIARTGLTADLLRAWERRYGVVRPQRTSGGQRLYSEEDVRRLTLIRRATAGGHRIAELARLDVAALEALVGEPAAAAPDTARGAGSAPSPDAVESLVAAALAAAERLDATALEATLRRGALALGGAALVDHVVSRLLRRIGARWHEGSLSPAHEHLASTVVRRVLAWVAGTYETDPRRADAEQAPRIVVATPAGELHEFGAMLAAAAAADERWSVVYLGASLPAADIAAAAAQVGARAVALSIVRDDALGEGAALDEVRAVARALPPGATLLVGGAAAERHAEALREVRARVLADIPALRATLRALRAAGATEAIGR